MVSSNSPGVDSTLQLEEEFSFIKELCESREAVVTLTLVIPGSPWAPSEFTWLEIKGGKAVCLSDGLEPDPRAGPPF